MRRTLSVILFIVGAWVLASEIMILFIDVGQPQGTSLAMVGILLAAGAPFLLLGMWASPGNRISDLGITMVIAAGVGGGCALTMFLMLNDPKFLLLLPLESPARNMRIALFPGAVNLVVLASVGWLLWSTGRRRQRRRTAEIGQIFGDE
jgi:hypothetical protein